MTQATAVKQALVPVTAPTTDPWAKGLSTSEGKIAISTVVVSLMVAVFSQVAPLFNQAALAAPQAPWLHAVATAVGILAASGTAIGYGAFRSGVKKVQIAADAQNAPYDPSEPDPTQPKLED